MYFYNDLLIKNGGVIGGGLLTAAHAKWLTTEPDSYRLDWASKEEMTRCMVDQMDFVLEAPNGDGTNYAVYYFREGIVDYYMFYIHIKNAKRGTVGRNEKFCDYTNLFVHLHIKEGGYSSSVENYLHYLLFFEPKVKISTNFGSNAYTGLNTGQPIPTGIIFNDTPMVKISYFPTLMKFTSTNTVTFNIRLEPKASAKDIGDVPANFVWYGNVYAEGEAVNGKTKWIQIPVPSGEFAGVAGYASENWIKMEEVKSDCSAEQAQIDTLTKELNQTKMLYGNLQKKVLDFKDYTEKAKESYDSL